MLSGLFSLAGNVQPCLGRRPTEIEFSYGRFGKPEINGDLICERLDFSISHSGELAL